MNEVFFEGCEHNEGFCSPEDCAGCQYGPEISLVECLIGKNPDGMACTETVEEAVRGSIDKLKGAVFADHGTLQAAVLSSIGRLDNALVRKNDAH